MKLAILVVYLVRAEDQKLLEVHLQRIEQHTRSPYRIHGVAVRLSEASRELLDRQPKVRLHELPTTAERSSKEHSYYLEQLIQEALQDGATHLVTLHVDSFPVRDGWDLELAGLTSEQCPVVSIPRDQSLDWKPSTACLFFTSEYRQRCAPSLLLSEATLSSPEYLGYLAKHDHMPDSGVGYGFDLHRRGLGWHPLLQSSTAGSEGAFGAVYGDMIYHLGGAVRFGRTAEHRRLRIPGLAKLRELALRVLPPAWRRALRGRVAGAMVGAVQNREFESERRRLLDDPDGHIAKLRGDPTVCRPVETTAPG